MAEAIASFGQSRRQKKRRPMADINVVPYIDVMLVLLVIFMATAPLLTQGVHVDLPAVDAKPMDPGDLEDPLVVSIRADGQIFLSLGAMTDDGEQVTLDALGEQAGKILRNRPEVPVMLRGDRKLPYGRVMEVMTTLQQAGARGVGLVTDPPALDG